MVLLFLFFLLFPNPSTTFAQTKEVNKYYSFLYKGQDFIALGDFEKAEAALLQAKTYGEKNFGARNPLLFFTYNGLGILNKQLGKYQEALDFYNKAVDIIKSSIPIKEDQLGTAYVNIGNICRLKGDYENSLQFNYNALNYLLKDSLKNAASITSCKNNIANIYFDQHQFKKAIKTAFPFIQSKDPQSKISAHEMLSRSYAALGQKEKALKYYQKEIALIKNTTGPE
ncbi:MAG: tetratricopeptide repeat protein, partial [Bacteroidota bacterium]|nr:tetratricopeptide repeat protein [Bacteroidota bacterium]